MKYLLIPLTTACLCYVVSTQNTGEAYRRSVWLSKFGQCGNEWVAGCQTKVIEPTVRCPCAPYLGISSEDAVGRLGGNMTLFCLFFGYPLPNITWRGPQDRLPVGRHTTSTVDMTLVISDVAVSDEGNYSCTASNDYGQIEHTFQMRFAGKTAVTIRGPKNESVDFMEEKEFVYECLATSDPRTPPTVRWYKTEPYNDSVQDEPPYVYAVREFLIIRFYPNCSSVCQKYVGEYRCVGDSGFNTDVDTITISYTPPTANNGRTKDRELQNPPNVYERVEYDYVGIPLETVRNNRPRTCSMYEDTGYDSIDQMLEDMARRTPAEHDANPYNRYESIDCPQRRTTHRSRPMQGEATMHDDMGLEKVRDCVEMDQYRVHGFDVPLSQSQKFPVSNGHPDSNNPYSDLSRREVSRDPGPETSDDSPKDMNLRCGLTTKEVNPVYLDLYSKDAGPYLDLELSKVKSNLDTDQKQLDLYLNMGQKGLDPNWNMGLTEVNPYLDLDPRQISPVADLNPGSISSPPYTALLFPKI